MKQIFPFAIFLFIFSNAFFLPPAIESPEKYKIAFGSPLLPVQSENVMNTPHSEENEKVIEPHFSSYLPNLITIPENFIFWEYNWHPDAIQEREIQYGNPFGCLFYSNYEDAVEYAQMEFTPENLANIKEKAIMAETLVLRERSTDLSNRFLVLEVFDPVVDEQCIIAKVSCWAQDSSNLKEIEAFTVFKNQHRHYPNFQPVLLLSINDIIELLYSIKDLLIAEDYTNSIIRHRAVQTFEQIVNCFFLILEDEELYEKSLNDLSKYGFFIKDKYANWTVKRISDPRLVSNNDLREFIEDMEITHDLLKRILYEVYDNKSMILHTNTGERFYWIPTDVFPHEPKPDDVRDI